MSVYWLQQTEAETPVSDDWLSGAEAERLAAFRFPKRRADWRLGRWTAKRAVSLYLNVPEPANIEIRTAATGAPEAFYRGAPAAAISLSHSSGSAICAVAAKGAVLGCDLERVETRSEVFIDDYFTEEENALVAAVPAAERACLATLIWSAKESALKALQAGLRLDTRSVRVWPSLGDAGGEAGADWFPLRVDSAGGGSFDGWWQRAGRFVRTIIASAYAPPVELR